MIKPTIVAVDLSAIFHQAYASCANEQISVSKQYHETMTRTISKINHIKTLDMGVAAPHVVICCDDRKSWRKELDPTYKAQREKQDAGFYDCLARTKERLTADGFPLLQVEGNEADDVIASLCRAARTAVLDVIVASPDKDLLQLVRNATSEGDTFVKQLRTHKMLMPDDVTVKLYDEAMVEEEFGVPPHKLGDYLALVGDVADNIAGIPGVGGKSAALILKEYGSINGLFGAAETGNYPWTEVKELSRCSTKLTAYFSPNAKDGIILISHNRILVGLKTDLPIDMEDVLRERKAEKLTKDNDFSGSYMAEDNAMDAVFIGEPERKQETKEAIPAATKEIAVRSVAMTQFDEHMNPTGMEAVYWYAKRAANSRVYLQKFASEDACLMAIMRGKDYGLSMTASLEMLQIIEGKISLPATFMADLARNHPDCEYLDVVDEGPEHCTVETKRKSDGRVFQVKFTLDMAKAAKLVKPNSGWEKYLPDMLYSRAISRCCRRHWSGAIRGAYSIEEMNDSQ